MTPQPQTFAELWRGRFSWALFAAGIICVLGAACVVLIVWLGDWPPEAWHQRLSILAWALIGMLAGALAVIVSFAIGGPVGRFKARIGGNEVEAEDHDDSTPTITTTTQVKP